MRYFYTDPLAAAWMAKHHGIKIEPISDIPSIKDFMWRGTGNFIGIWEEDKYYIHPDSLHLLEPREGDLWAGMGEDAHYCVWYMDSAETAARFKINTELRARMVPYQRNGIVFMWPEVEK